MRRSAILGAAESARRVVKAAQRDLPGVFVGRAGAQRVVRTLPEIPLRGDTDETYREFIAGRAVKNPKMVDLVEAVRSLQEAFREHVRDGHGGNLVDVVGDISRLRDEVLLGDGVVDLSLPPHARGNVRCWRDAGRLCCSVRVLGPNGDPRVATTCSPIANHVERVVGYVRDAGVDEVEALSYLPDLVPRHGGGELLTRLADAGVVGAVRSRETFPCFGTISSENAITWKDEA